MLKSKQGATHAGCWRPHVLLLPLLIMLLASFCLMSIEICNAALAQNVPNADLLEMKGVFLKHVNDDRAAIASNEALLARAQAAHQEAVSNKDQDGAFVTAEAIGNAQAALDKARQNLTDDQTRLGAVNQALLLWHTVGDSIGPRALATLIRGQITVDTPQGSKPFDRFAPVQEGQHIHVGPNSFLELQLADGSTMHIGPGSEFLYERDVEGIYWDLFHGEMHKISVIMAVRGANDEPHYRGITSVAAVRGTDFTLATDGQQDTYTVLEGEIEVDPGAGRPKVTLTRGQMLSVRKTGAVAPVTTFDPATMQKWWER